MNNAKIVIEKTDNGLSLEVGGAIPVLGLMLGEAIADIESKLPVPSVPLFREAVKIAYKRGCERDETKAASGCE